MRDLTSVYLLEHNAYCSCLWLLMDSFEYVPLFCNPSRRNLVSASTTVVAVSAPGDPRIRTRVLLHRIRYIDNNRATKHTKHITRNFFFLTKCFFKRLIITEEKVNEFVLVIYLYYNIKQEW